MYDTFQILKKNLMSLGTRDSKEFKYTSWNAVLWVLKGALVVVKGFMQSTLYVLLRNGCEFGCNLSISKFKINLIIIMWLGHICEKGMTILSNQCLRGNHKVVKLDFMNIAYFVKQHSIISFQKLNTKLVGIGLATLGLSGFILNPLTWRCSISYFNKR